jgi:hypothetical protein
MDFECERGLMPNIRASYILPDIDVVEETALATAQATLQIAINKSKASKEVIAKRAGEFNIAYTLRGGHNLTVKTMARIAYACGYEIEFKLKRRKK